MDGYLRYNSASQTRTVGAFVDSTDFVTLENALTIANTDIKIKKNGEASGNKNSGGATADGSGGLYHLTWDATDTAFLGQLSYSIKVAGALVAFGSYQVLDQTTYDAMFGTTGAVPLYGITHRGTAQSATATTLVLDAGAAFANDVPNGSTLWAYGQTQGYWQSRPVTDYVLSTDTATVPTWDVTPSGAPILYYMFGTAPADPAGAGGLDAAGVRAAVGLASANLDTQLADVPTVSEMNARTLTSASYATQTSVDDVPTNAELATAISAALTATIADSIPADGTRPSIQQGIYMLVQFMLERSVSGTTATVKKSDGSTSLFTLTLNSSTLPTSITRAT